MAEQGIGVLEEHQNPNVETTAPGEYTATPEEKKAVKLVEKLFSKAKKHRSKYDEHWLDYYKMFRGKQWKEQRPSYRHSEVINFIFQAIQGTVPVLTDARPRFDFLPEEPQDMELSEILSEVAEADWQRNNWSTQLTEALYDAAIMGTGMGYLGYDPKARQGAGAIEFCSEDPFYCFPDPNAHDVNLKARYFIKAEPVDIEVLKRDYPSKKDVLKPDLVDLMQGEKTDLDQVKFKSPVDNKSIIEGSSSYEAQYKDQALKVTLYLLDDEVMEEEKKRPGADGMEESYFEQRLKYPHGRKIVTSAGICLEDGPMEFEDGKIPYARLVNYCLPREFWGMGDVEQLSSPQKTFNKLVSFALDTLTLMGNPIWVVGTGSGVDTDNLFNRPGLIVEADDINQVKRQEGVQLQPYVLQLIDRMRDWFVQVSGNQDVSQGVKPEGVTAASAITALQEAAQTRTRLKSRFMDAFLNDIGQMYRDRVFQYYTAPQVKRLTGKDGAQKFFKFHIANEPVNPEQPDGEQRKVAYVRNYRQDPETKQYVEDLEARKLIINGGFDIRVATGSALPFAKVEKSNLAFKLKEAGAIDEVELLKAVEYPNAEAVWARVQSRKQEQMAAEAAAQAPPPPPGAPGPGGPPPGPPAAPPPPQQGAA